MEILKKKASDAIKEKVKNLQKNEVKTQPKKAPVIRSKSDLKDQIKKQSWFKNVKGAVKSGVSIQQVKQILKSSGNVKGDPSFWRKVAEAVKTKNIQRIVRLVSLPVRAPVVWRRPVYYPPQKRWVLRYRSYVTWRWSYYYRGYWARHCYRRWWWVTCYWCRHGGGYYWYRYYYWTGYNYWSYE